MSCRMIVTGHGTYASALQSTLELIAGKQERLHFIDFQKSLSPEMLKREIATCIDSHSSEEWVVVCDLLGGTPFKMAVELAYNVDSIEVIAGCNVGAMVEGIMRAEFMSSRELVDFLLEATVRSVMKFEAITEETPILQAVEDGI